MHLWNGAIKKELYTGPVGFKTLANKLHAKIVSRYQFWKTGGNGVVPRKFCAAPWSGGVLRITGEFVPCGFSNQSYGDWKKYGVKAVWHGDVAKHFRSKISAGEFPCSDCERCFNNGNHSYTKILYPIIATYSRHYRVVSDAFSEHPELLQHIGVLRQTFGCSEINKKIAGILYNYFTAINQMQSFADAEITNEASQSLDKLQVIGRVFKSYFEGNLEPPVAPSRQVLLISICNIACIHCPGTHTGTIVDGVDFKGRKLKQLTLNEAMQAFESPEDMVQFYMNGSEFLLYKHWRDIAELLSSNGVKLALSTNGMLLTKANVERLLAFRLVRQINISLDGGTKETIERIRAGVKYDKLVRNIRYLIEKSNEAGYNYRLTFSFVLMKSNYAELPGLTKLLASLRDGCSIPRLEIGIRPLCIFHSPEYLKFLEQEHPSRIDENSLTKMFLKLQQASHENNIPVSVPWFARPSIDSSLDHFIAGGMQMPATPEVLQQQPTN